MKTALQTTEYASEEILQECRWFWVESTANPELHQIYWESYSAWLPDGVKGYCPICGIRLGDNNVAFDDNDFYGYGCDSYICRDCEFESH